MTVDHPAIIKIVYTIMILVTITNSINGIIVKQEKHFFGFVFSGYSRRQLLLEEKVTFAFTDSPSISNTG